MAEVGFGGAGNYATLEDYKRAKGYQASDAGQTFSNRQQPPLPTKVQGGKGFLGLEVQGEPYAAQNDLRNYQYGGGPGFADAATERYQTAAGQAGARGAYQMDPSQQNSARGFQSAAAVDYLRSMNGTNPSVAQRQMQLGLGQAQGNALGMAAGARGGGANQAAAMRSALAANNQMASQTNQQAGIEAIREREAARQGLANVGGQMRGQDIGWQHGQGNLEMQQRGLNDATRLGFERLGADVQNQQLQASQNYGQNQLQAELAQRGQNFDAQKQNRAGGIFGAIGDMFGSDEKMKKDVSAADEDDLDTSPFINDIDQAKADMASNPYMRNTAAYAGSLAGDGDPELGDNATFNLSNSMARSADTGRQAMARMAKEGGEYDRRTEARQRAFQQAYEEHRRELKKKKPKKGGLLNGFLRLFGSDAENASGESTRIGWNGSDDGFFSDQKAKKDKGSAKRSELQKFARGMEAKTFRYKGESESAPKRTGVMAQDMEKSKAGKSAVRETPVGKMVDMPRAISLALATIAEMREEIDELKGGKKKKPVGGK